MEEKHFLPRKTEFLIKAKRFFTISLWNDYTVELFFYCTIGFTSKNRLKTLSNIL